jgi:hypothetical protein
MLTVNPPTAWGLLHDHVELEAGDWVIQNAANSGVGACMIALTRRLGLRLVSVVRRDDAVAELRRQGSDVVLVDGPDLPERARAAIAGGRLRLGIDAIGGEATARIAAALDDGGVAVNTACSRARTRRSAGRDVVFRGVRLEGFWLVHWFGRHPRRDRTRLRRARRLARRRHDLGAIAARYPLSRVREALEHAARDARGGKILLVPDSRTRPDRTQTTQELPVENDDRRKFERIPHRHRGPLLGPEEEVAVMSRDLSLGGLFLGTVTPAPVRPPSPCLHLPAPHGEVQARGTVMHCLQGIGMGVEFADFDGDGAQRLRHYLEHVERLT